MPTQKELSDLRKRFLEQREELLKKKVSALQVRLYERVFESYLSELHVVDGNLVSNRTNINLVEGLDKVFDKFQSNDHMKVIREFSKDLQTIVKLNTDYFANIDRSASFESQAKTISNLLNKRLGINSKGQMIKGGFLNKFVTDTRVRDEIKDMTGKAVASGQSFQDFRKQLKGVVEGNPQRQGGLQQYYRNFAYDTIQQVDRTAGLQFADRLEMNFAVYNGGVIETSRPICVEHNGKLVSRQEILSWADLDWAKKLKSYNPLTDLGGPGCRHTLDWVTDSFARRNWQRYNGVPFPFD